MTRRLRRAAWWLAGAGLPFLSACATAPPKNLWEHPPEPNPAAPADFVAWADHCAKHGVTDNAWPLYEQLVERVPKPTAKERLYLGYAVMWPWEEERFAPAAGWLDSAADAFDLLRGASQHDSLYIPLDSSSPYLLKAAFKSGETIRMAARGLVAAGWREFSRGHPEQLCQDIPVLLRTTRHLYEAVNPTRRLGKGSFARMIYRDVMLQMLDRAEDPGRVAADLAAKLRRNDPPISVFRRTVMLQYATLADVYQRIYRLDEVTGEYVIDRAELEPVRAAFRKLQSLTEEELTEYLLPSDYQASMAFLAAYYDKLLELADLPYEESLWRAEGLDKSIAKNGTFLSYCTVRRMRRYLIASHQKKAYRRGAHLVYAIWAHRHRRGAFPESLDGLEVPDLAELRRDPFATGDFQFRLTPEGFTLYSLGADHTDQGGSHQEDWGLKQGGDYVFWPVQPITPPWLRPRILITSDGRILEQPRDGGPVREISPEELGIVTNPDADKQEPEGE